MQVKIHFDGIETSPWLEEFMNGRLTKLGRFLTTSSTVYVHLKFDNGIYTTGLAIHSNAHDHAFSADGDNLYESFSSAIDKASRVLGEEKRKLKDKIHRKYASVNAYSSEASY